MNELLEADQTLPYKLMKNKFLSRKRYNDLLYIVNKNIPNIDPNQVIEIFKGLSENGCTYEALANIIFNQIYTDDENFKKMFGFSLYIKGTNKLDLNKLLIDIYSKLYGIIRARLVEYKVFSFDSIKEATINLLNKEFDLDSDAIIELFKNGFYGYGIDSNGKLLFISNNPIITTYVGSCKFIAEQKFGVTDVSNIKELKLICASNNIELQYRDEKNSEKLSGLFTDNFNFWSNYYLEQSGVDISLSKEHINKSDYPLNYNDFMDFINAFISNGYSISVSTEAGSDVYMHTSKSMSWGRVSSNNAGHTMLFKRFSDSNDIIVSSYGEDYIIPKEYYMKLSFDKIQKSLKSVNEMVEENNVQKKI